MKDINIWKKKTKEEILFSGNFIYIVQKPSEEGESADPKEELLPGLEPLKPEVPKQPESGVPIDKGKENKEKGLHPNFPPRSPDAMTAEEYADAWSKCKTIEDKQRLMVSQAAEGAFSPDNYDPKYYETTVNGISVKIPIYTLGSKMALTPDPQSMQAMANMMNGYIPPAKLYKRLYNDPKVKKMPAFAGKQVEAWMRKHGRNPAPIHVRAKNGKIQMNGVAMQSAEYMRAESDMRKEWLKANGVRPNELIVGGGKTILMPRDNGNAGMTFGGGLSATPDGRGGYRASDNIIQPIGSIAHSTIYFDYMSIGDIMGPSMQIGGKWVATKDVFEKPEYKDIVDALFNDNPKKKFIYKKYQCKRWMTDKVNDYVREHPPGEAPEPVKGDDRVQAEEPIAEAEPLPGLPTPSAPPVATEEAPEPPPSSGGAPTGGGAPSGGGAPYGGGGPSLGPSVGGAPPITTPEPSPTPTPTPTPTPEPPSEPPEKTEPIDQPEKIPEGFKFPKGKKCFVLGDSHGGGWDPQMRRLSSKHGIGMPVEKMWKDGRHTPTMLGKFENLVKSAEHNKALKEQLNGSTLVICAGGNDLLSNFTAEQIFENLQKIFELAKSVGMKVVTSTIIGVADYYRKDQKEKLKKVMDKTSKVNKMLIAESKRAGSNIDVMLDLYSVFEDPNNPGFLNPKDKGDTVHLQIGSKGSYAKAATRIIAGVAKANEHNPNTS